MNNLAPIKNCPWGGGVQGNLNWMPGYRSEVIKLSSFSDSKIKCNDWMLALYFESETALKFYNLGTSSN